MEIVNIGSMQLNDSQTRELSYIVVRTADDSIGIGMSQESSGEAEIFMGIEKCELLIGLLNTALVKAKSMNK